MNSSAYFAFWAVHDPALQCIRKGHRFNDSSHIRFTFLPSSPPMSHQLEESQTGIFHVLSDDVCAAISLNLMTTVCYTYNMKSKCILLKAGI